MSDSEYRKTAKELAKKISKEREPGHRKAMVPTKCECCGECAAADTAKESFRAQWDQHRASFLKKLALDASHATNPHPENDSTNRLAKAANDLHDHFLKKLLGKNQRGHDELNAQHLKQKVDSEFTTFASMANNKPLEPWQTQFLELAIRTKDGHESLAMSARPRGKTIGKLYVEITTFGIIRNLAQTELKAAFLLRSKVTSKHGGNMILPAVNYYLDRSLLFYDLSAQTKKASQALKAYKRAKLVCTAIKYLTNSERQNRQPSPRVIAVIRGEVRL